MKFLLIWWTFILTLLIYFVVLGIREQLKPQPHIKVPVKILKSIEDQGFGRCFAVLEDIKIGAEFYLVECADLLSEDSIGTE